VSATLDAPSAADSSLSTTTRSVVFGRRWLHGAAVVRILFGVLWACDASFKWQPGFIHGQTLHDELGKVAQVHTPVIHQWLALTHMIGIANPPVTAAVIAIIETLAALALIFGVLSNAAFVGSAILSFGIWSSAEAFHLPFHSGMTDLGPSVGYIFVTGPVLRSGRLDLERRQLAAPASRSIRLAGSARCRGPRRLICVRSSPDTANY
jgi:thiosulfate dehydrogenase (quinone) large subunit